MVPVKSNLMIVLLVMTFAILSTGCRPGDTVPDVVIDEEIPDTVGVWEDDPVISDMEQLRVYQEELDPVFFDFDKSDFTSEALDVLMTNASFIMNTPGFRVLIEGHADERGTIDYNLALGERRAVAIYNYLVNFGIPSERLEYISFGKEKPFDPGSNERAWALNRRGHFRVLPEN